MPRAIGCFILFRNYIILVQPDCQCNHYYSTIKLCFTGYNQLWYLTDSPKLPYILIVQPCVRLKFAVSPQAVRKSSAIGATLFCVFIY